MSQLPVLTICKPTDDELKITWAVVAIRYRRVTTMSVVTDLSDDWIETIREVVSDCDCVSSNFLGISDDDFSRYVFDVNNILPVDNCTTMCNPSHKHSDIICIEEDESTDAYEEIELTDIRSDRITVASLREHTLLYDKLLTKLHRKTLVRYKYRGLVKQVKISNRRRLDLKSRIRALSEESATIREQIRLVRLDICCLVMKTQA